MKWSADLLIGNWFINLQGFHASQGIDEENPSRRIQPLRQSWSRVADFLKPIKKRKTLGAGCLLGLTFVSDLFNCCCKLWFRDALVDEVGFPCPPKGNPCCRSTFTSPHTCEVPPDQWQRIPPCMERIQCHVPGLKAHWVRRPEFEPLP